ncbi:DNA-directed RNA polymerase III subunit RPC8 [Aricia agestis]|uniref:DNA-directed RNA polymerase III subunit RPC8 n=1 Tax=Aricia agestis TaxID=91739 RepID=UPI001C202999|nr:DNA-directed RNA polymerase III subunit RPC8 [Aricia agestis]
MFVLSEMKDVIRITPQYFHQSLAESITTLLNRKLANKVVLDVGLCIALFDITDIGHSHIFPGDGSSHTEVKFRFIIFRPMVEEILTGKIRSCSREGVHVTLGFFDDILIPVNALQHPSRFDETEQAWVWEYPKEDGEKHDLFMDSGESIRFRVTSETFEESIPSGPQSTECPVQTIAPYKLTGGINEPGLGLLTWWESQEQDDDGDEEEEDKEE